MPTPPRQDVEDRTWYDEGRTTRWAKPPDDFNPDSWRSFANEVIADLDITQSDLAQMLLVQPANFTKYLSGQMRISPELAVKWADRWETWREVANIVDVLSTKKATLLRNLYFVAAFYQKGHVGSAMRSSLENAGQYDRKSEQEHKSFTTNWPLEYAIRWTSLPKYGEEMVNMCLDKLDRDIRSFHRRDLLRIHKEVPPEELFEALAACPIRERQESRRREISEQQKRAIEAYYYEKHGDPTAPENDGMYDPFAVDETPLEAV